MVLSTHNEPATEDLSKHERASLLIEYWKQTSNVQQHFNDVSMKLRNFAVVVFSGFLTGVGLAIHNDISISILNVNISAGVLFALAGFIATQLIHFMDTYWYHVFLKGSSSTILEIEKEIASILGVGKLSEGITNNSGNVGVISLFGKLHFPIGWKSWLSKFFFIREVKVDSTKRHKIFYRWLLAIFIITGVGSVFTTSNKEIKEKTIDHDIFIKFDNSLKESAAYVISGSNVRVRDGASFDSEIIDVLPIGKVVFTNGNRESSWVYLSYKNDEGRISKGWVHRDFITNVKN